VNPTHTRRPRGARNVRRAGVALLAVLVLAALAAAAASGCGGSSSSGAPAAGATPTAIQVMATATRGDLTQSAMGIAKVTKAGGKLVAVATIDAQNASSVAEGQSATVFFMRGGALPQAGQSGMPQPQGSGMPQPQGSGMPAPGGSGMPVPQGGASGAPFPQGGQGGQSGFPGGSGARGGAEGTVTAVATNADGTAAATISLDKVPSGVKAGSTGFARIEVKVIAKDVILVPTAAVKGSGDSATVQVSANGKTETRTITAGQQSGAMTEVVSGLGEGENVVYTQAFRGFPGGRQSGAPFPQQGGQSGGQSGGSY
jgi:membrane fusion protein, macrolide-specific efflux system